MGELSSAQRAYLKGLAHGVEPVVQVGRNGISENLASEVSRALFDHELIKVKFVYHKQAKGELSEELAEKTGAVLVGRVGNVAILYLEHPDAERRRIRLP